MKRLLCFLLLAMAIPAMADGIYTSAIDGKECKIEFVVGPFGPGETGYAKLYYDDDLIGEYNYRKTDSDSLQVYDVLGLCMFIVNGDKLESVKHIATFSKIGYH